MDPWVSHLHSYTKGTSLREDGKSTRFGEVQSLTVGMLNSGPSETAVGEGAVAPAQGWEWKVGMWLSSRRVLGADIDRKEHWASVGALNTSVGSVCVLSLIS